jgi:hypothetical protein
MFKFLGKQEDGAADDLVVPVDEKVRGEPCSGWLPTRVSASPSDRVYIIGPAGRNPVCGSVCSVSNGIQLIYWIPLVRSVCSCCEGSQNGVWLDGGLGSMGS